MNPSDEERLERLKQSLYSQQNAPQVDPDDRSGLSTHEEEVQGDWREEVKRVGGIEHDRPGLFSRAGKWLLYASIGFLLIAIAVVAFLFLRGFNFVSADNVEVSIVGPVSVAAGDELLYDVSVTNNNSSRLENVRLIAIYPPGSRVAGDLERELVQTEESLRNIAPGETVKQSMRGILFGQKGSEQTVTLLLEYSLPDSTNGSFEKKTEYNVLIESAPIIMSIDRPGDVYSNQRIEFTVTLQANANAPIENVLLQADYPFGFRYESSSIDPAFSNDVWFFEKLDPKQKIDVTIVGRLEGGENDERTIRFRAGTQSTENEEAIGVVFVEQAESITLRKPLIDLQFNWGNGSEAIGQMGDPVQARLEWKNTSGDTLRDVEISLQISGDVLNESSVRVSNGGFYQSNSDTITWNRNTTNSLREIQPGQSGSLGFSFATLDPTESVYTNYRNPQVDVVVKAEGERSNNRDFFVESDAFFALITDAFVAVDVNRVSGPYPPRVENETIYEVTWSVQNSFNRIDQGELRAVLPPAIRWIGATGPEADRVTFNPTTREVVWSLGVIEAGSGYTRSLRQTTFQVGLTPSANQTGDRPTILEASVLTGLDTFVNRPVTEQAGERDSRASNELADGRVTQ